MVSPHPAPPTAPGAHPGEVSPVWASALKQSAQSGSIWKLDLVLLKTEGRLGPESRLGVTWEAALRGRRPGWLGRGGEERAGSGRVSETDPAGHGGTWTVRLDKDSRAGPLRTRGPVSGGAAGRDGKAEERRRKRSALNVKGVPSGNFRAPVGRAVGCSHRSCGRAGGGFGRHLHVDGVRATERTRREVRAELRARRPQCHGDGGREEPERAHSELGAATRLRDLTVPLPPLRHLLPPPPRALTSANAGYAVSPARGGFSARIREWVTSDP